MSQRQSDLLNEITNDIPRFHPTSLKSGEALCSFGEPACVREKSVNGLMNSPKNPGEALLLDQCSPTGGETSGD